MSLLAQAPSLSLFAPVLAATAIALFVLVLGRVVAKAKAVRAGQISDNWAPSIPAPPNHPLNRVEPMPRRRTTFTEWVDPVDSGAITLRFARAVNQPSGLTPLAR